MYDRGTPLNQFIEEFNSISSSISEFNTKYQGMVEQINFITSAVLPRYSGRPAIFESVTAMISTDTLVDGDICLTFNQGTEANSTKFIEAYKVEKIASRPNDTHIALKDKTLGAFLIPTSGEFEQIMGQINSVSASLTDFIATKGKNNGLASLGTDGKLTSSQLPNINIPEVNSVTNTKDGLMKSTDYVNYQKLAIPTASLKYAMKQQGANDFNSITEAGLYYVNSSTNAPTTSTSWALIVTNASSMDNANYVQQIAIGRDEHTKLYIRRKNSSTWSAWEVYNSFNDSLKGKLDSYEFLNNNRKNVYVELLNVDLNTLTRPGFYTARTVTNVPITTYNNWGLIITNTSDLNGSWVQQIAIAENNHQAIYIRRKNNTTWSTWEKFNAFTDEDKTKLAQYEVLDSTQNQNLYAKYLQTDFNNATTPGIHFMYTAVNAPTTNNVWGLIVIVPAALSGSSNIQQIAIARNDTTKMYTRNKNNNVWSEWSTFNALTDALLTKLNELNYTRALTQTQYDALSEAEKNRADVWYGIYK